MHDFFFFRMWRQQFAQRPMADFDLSLMSFSCNQNSCPIEGCSAIKTVVPLKAVLQPKQLSHWRLFCNQNSCPFEGCTSIKTVIWSYERIPVSQKSKQLYLLFKVVIKPKKLYSLIKGLLQLRQLSYWMCPTTKTCPFWDSP